MAEKQKKKMQKNAKRYAFNANAKTYEQVKISLTQQTQSEESLKEKRKAFIGICPLSTWFNKPSQISKMAKSR